MGAVADYVSALTARKYTVSIRGHNHTLPLDGRITQLLVTHRADHTSENISSEMKSFTRQHFLLECGRAGMHFEWCCVVAQAV